MFLAGTKLRTYVHWAYHYKYTVRVLYSYTTRCWLRSNFVSSRPFDNNTCQVPKIHCPVRRLIVDELGLSTLQPWCQNVKKGYEYRVRVGIKWVGSYDSRTKKKDGCWNLSFTRRTWRARRRTFGNPTNRIVLQVAPILRNNADADLHQQVSQQVRCALRSNLVSSRGGRDYAR